jgi:catechol 2,3-dioxygenase-like lactoylglutathione lyase family enzyme
MTLKVAELHHCAVRIPPGPDAAGAALRFYNDVVGLESDHVPWDRPGEGQRINAGSHAQVHLLPGAPAKMLATGELDLSAPHLAFAVMSIDEAQAELDRLEVPYRVAHGRLGPDSRRLFLADPAGNLIELHQLGTCRCTARARDGIGQARVSGTVLFADMRGFTAVAERLAPADVVPLRMNISRCCRPSRGSTAAPFSTWQGTGSWPALACLCPPTTRAAGPYPLRAA